MKPLYLTKETSSWTDVDYSLYDEKPKWDFERQAYVVDGTGSVYEINYMAAELLAGRELMIGEMIEIAVDPKHLGYYVEGGK